MEAELDAAAAVENAHRWFEGNSGWAPPDPDELAEWLADGVCRCPDDCLAEPTSWCVHGLASWYLILAALDEQDKQDEQIRGSAGFPHRPDR